MSRIGRENHLMIPGRCDLAHRAMGHRLIRAGLRQMDAAGEQEPNSKNQIPNSKPLLETWDLEFEIWNSPRRGIHCCLCHKRHFQDSFPGEAGILPVAAAEDPVEADESGLTERILTVGSLGGASPTGVSAGSDAGKRLGSCEGGPEGFEKATG